MSNIIIYPESLSALVLGKEFSAKTPTELYVAVMADILVNYPQIIGRKETHFTSDAARAGQYTGTTRSININGRTIFIKTGFSTKDKWNGIEKTCQLAGLTFELNENTSVTSKPVNNSIIEVAEPPKKSIHTNDANKIVQNYNEPLISDIEETKFAFHSEFYHYEETYFSGRDWRKMDQEAAFFNGCIYFQLSQKSDVVFKIYPDKRIKVIRLKESFPNAKIAVNNNGIFMLKDRSFILFSEEGELKTKLKIKNSLYIDAVYIYDTHIYIADDKGRIHWYDIYGASDIVIWDFSKERKTIEQAVAEDILKFTGEKIKPKIDMRNTFRVHSLCANGKNIIAGFRFDAIGKYRDYMYEIFICINPVPYSWRILQVRNRNDNSARIFTFDMRNNLIWWFRENKDGDKYLYSTEVKCIDDNIRNNTRLSYKIPSCISLEPYIYFDGRRAYATHHAGNYPHNGDIGGFYFDSINPNGDFIQWNPDTANGTSSDFFVLGNQIKAYHYGLFSSGTYNDPILFQLLPDTYEEYKTGLGNLKITKTDIETVLKEKL